jgi:hypothetical protein
MSSYALTASKRSRSCNLFNPSLLLPKSKLKRDRIADFVGETGVRPVQLSAAERNAVVQSLKDRLNVDVEAQMPWDAVDAPHGVQTTGGWKLVPLYVAEAPCLVFSDGATSIWKFANGAELLLFLEESPPFEFYG